MLIIKWFAALLAVSLLISLLIPTFAKTAKRGNLTIAISNCRQITTALWIYAAEHDGTYPKGATANEVYRELFKSGIISHEHIFECPLSPYRADQRIGSPPLYNLAVQAGENHWAMTAGINTRAPAHIPLVFENPVHLSWPPKWNASAAGRPIKGRSWMNGKIIIGSNDSSVMLHQLSSHSGDAVELAPLNGETLNAFEKAIDPQHYPIGSFLPVE